MNKAKNKGEIGEPYGSTVRYAIIIKERPSAVATMGPGASVHVEAA